MRVYMLRHTDYSCMCTVTHSCLDHLHSLSSDLGNDGGDVDHTLVLSLLEGYVHGDEGAATSHTSTGLGGTHRNQQSLLTQFSK